ncbi:MAG: hypothetical protein HGA80_08410 [Candidatus Omnitrophica bacterium]|nr:hypothetical protein [Candidatus Omnitrophota bacterium]
MVFVIAGIVLAVMLGLVYYVWRMPESPVRKKKPKREPPPEPAKDWQGITERLEKRLKHLEEQLAESGKIVRQKDKDLAERQSEIADVKQQFQLEQTWRKKEEEAVSKEKRREKLLEDELAQARESVSSEVTGRIKLEYEVKELRTQKESALADVRRLAGQNMELERKVKALSEDNRDLRRENDQLKVKKEANEWVAKDDFIRVEKLLKRSRWEVDLFKRKFAGDLWPRELQTRPVRAPRDEPDNTAPAAPAPAPVPPEASVSDAPVAEAVPVAPAAPAVILPASVVPAPVPSPEAVRTVEPPPAGPVASSEASGTDTPAAG